jgi:hypothetical protein
VKLPMKRVSSHSLWRKINDEPLPRSGEMQQPRIGHRRRRASDMYIFDCCPSLMYKIACAQRASLLQLSEYVFWPFAALRSLPVDVLIRYFNVASFAVNAAGKSQFNVQQCLHARITHFWALIWNLTPKSLLSSSTYSYTPAGQNRFSTPLYLGHSFCA